MVLTIDRIRMLGRRHQRYILAYLGLEYAKETIGDGNGGDDNDELNSGLPRLQLPEMSCRLVERLIKVYTQLHKCHRNVLDQETGFFDQVASWMRHSQARNNHN